MAAVYGGVFLFLLALTSSCGQDINLSEFSRAILLMTNETLGVKKMEVPSVNYDSTLDAQ